MTNPRVGKTLRTGLALAFGLLIGNVVVMPLISDRTPLDGLGIGVIAGLLALVAYSAIAIARNSSDAK
jgi:hypothetical protein